MVRPSFRPRPIDLNKPLPIVKTTKDLKHDEDNVAVARALPAMATGVDPTEEEVCITFRPVMTGKRPILN